MLAVASVSTSAVGGACLSVGVLWVVMPQHLLLVVLLQACVVLFTDPERAHGAAMVSCKPRGLT
jgi:hypothetical protein